MPAYPRNSFTLEDALAAAIARGYKPPGSSRARAISRERFNFNSRACHVGGDNPGGCWATVKDGRVYFHCHKHGESKADWLEAQRRITANLGLPEYRLPPEAGSGGKAYQVREWTYHNPTTGESAVQVVERYDGPCWRKDCPDRFPHKHPWLKRDEKHAGQPTDGFLLLEHGENPENGPKSPKIVGCPNASVGNPCISCVSCTRTAVLNNAASTGEIQKWCIITEGETTAEAAAVYGWRAFSFQGGSNGAGRADYSPVAGLSVLIAPDNDRPGTKAALSAAIRCIEVGAHNVQIMPTDAFQRRGEDLADLDADHRARVIESGWFAGLRLRGPLLVELAAHNLQDRCLAATWRPLIEASDREHLNEHVDQAWQGILEREERRGLPELFVKDGRLVYLQPGTETGLAITEHTRDSIAILSAASVYWHQGFASAKLTDEPQDPNAEDAWEAAAAELDAAEGVEHGRVQRLEASTRDQTPSAYRYDLRTPKKRHPQRAVTNALLINPPEDVPELEAVIPHPFLNAAGDTLVTDEGYHPSERLYLENAHRFAPMPIADAIAALDDLLVDFPFPTPADRTNLFAALITKICRRSYSIAPLMMIDKPKSGTGASLLSEVVALLTTGRRAMRVTYCNGEFLEFEKRVAATCRNANGIVLLDNLSGTITSNMLAELLTAEDKFMARELGSTRNMSIDPRNYVLVATANNVSMAAELVNRTLHIRLDANMERPDQRDGFRHPSIIEHMNENLPRLRNAALSLVHSWLESDRPAASELPKALRRFPAWQRQTTAVLEAARFTDFAANAIEFEERAITEAEASVRPFIQWWWETHQSNPVGIKELAPMALGDPADEDADGMLQINGSHDKQRRINLAKMVKTWLHQTYELEDTTVRVVAGPLYKNRYATWFLQTPDGTVGGFPLFSDQTDVLVQETQEMQGFPTLAIPDTPDSGQKRPCGTCGDPLLPDERGPDCEKCGKGE